jgi:cobalt-zinc-cadmium efflux system membrane fusion protein
MMRINEQRTPGRMRAVMVALCGVLVLAGCSDDDAADEHAGHEASAASTAVTHAKGAAGAAEAAAQPNGDGREGRHAGESGASDRIRLDAEQRASLDLKIASVEGGAARQSIRAPATVQFDPDSQQFVGPRVEARVAEVLVDLGDRVEAGTPLARLDSVALGRARAQLITARARFETARAELARESELAQQDITSEAELARVRAAHAEARAEVEVSREPLRVLGLGEEEIDATGASGAPLSRMLLRAPIDGVVQRRSLVPGELLAANETPIHLVHPVRYWVFAAVSEQDVAAVDVGNRLAFRSRSLPGERFEADVDWISTRLEPESRTVRVRAVVEDPQGHLRDGLYGQAEIRADGETRWPMVPVDALQEIEGTPRVFVPGNQPDSFVARRVVPGAEGNGLVEIRSGLSVGDQVIVGGAFDLMSALTARTRSAAHSH